MTPTDKRKHIRIDSISPSNVNIYSNNILVREGEGKTVNISKGGVLLETKFPIEEDQKLGLTINLEKEFVYISGKVAHTNQQKENCYLTGVEFFAIDETGQDILEKYIAIFMEKSTSGEQSV
ncbi:MAG: PilZ domain-containing protein [Thermodesulfobacteriota bacterium]|nr:PilZ domain-containing protein [Thermodesulfobacteriota bacterium]